MNSVWPFCTLQYYKLSGSQLIQSYLSFCMASGQGVRLCIMGGYSFSEVCIPELYYIMYPFRASHQGLTLFVMVIDKIIGVFSLQQWLFRFWCSWPGQLLPRKQGIWTLKAQKSTSQNAYSVLRYPKFLCNIHFERYAICLYNFPLTDFVNPNVYAIWGVMHYESDAKREVWLYANRLHLEWRNRTYL